MIETKTHKYSEIHCLENKDGDRYLEECRRNIPGLDNELYVVQEKIHGMNMGIILGEELLFVARGDKKPKKNHSGIVEYIDKTPSLKEMLRYFSKQYPGATLYGEYYGNKLSTAQIDYGCDYGIKFFDMRDANWEYIPQCDLFLMFDDFIATKRESVCRTSIDDTYIEYLVPGIKYKVTLKEALATDLDRLTMINPVEGNLAEGIVIKPMYKALRSSVSGTFRLKIKHPNFNEVKRQKIRIVLDDGNRPQELKDIKQEFVAYLTENRYRNVLSHGIDFKGREHKVGMFIKDAYDDFKKDYPELIISADNHKGGKEYVKAVFDIAAEIIDNMDGK